MFLQRLDLTTALRPNLYDDESLLFVQDGVGLYEGKLKIPNHQNGHLYLTSHRVCYVDNEEPRKHSLALDLKDIERTEFYAGFLRSSAKITLFPKPTATNSARGYRVSDIRYGSSLNYSSGALSPSPRPSTRSPTQTRGVPATWVCTICGLPNSVPANFDPSTANEFTPLTPCQACGIKPPLVQVVKVSIAALSNRPPDGSTNASRAPPRPVEADSFSSIDSRGRLSDDNNTSGQCRRCTFVNHPSLSNCEICGASLTPTVESNQLPTSTSHQRPESPGPEPSNSVIDDETIETIKFSFRAGGEKVFLERIKGALVQRKWLLQSAPPVPKPTLSTTLDDLNSWQSTNGIARSTTPQQRVVGIAGLERRGAELRENNQAVIGTAFEDLEALMTSAKEVIAMAEQFAEKTSNGEEGVSAEARTLLSDSASALGLVTTKDMFGSGSASDTLYTTELARNLAEFLTDDRKGILRKEGGIMSLVDLWSLFNRTRNGIELVSPLDCEKAANMWESLQMPLRLRRFKSGLVVVQEKSRSDEKAIASLLHWLREPQLTFPPAEDAEDDWLGKSFGRGVTAQETAEKFGWSVGVATEELEMAEETGALCREQSLNGIKFWENHFQHVSAPPNLEHSQLTDMKI